MKWLNIILPFVLLAAAIGTFLTYRLYYSPEALRLRAIQTELQGLTNVVKTADSEAIVKYLDARLTPDAKVNLTITFSLLAMQRNQTGVPQNYTREGFLELVRTLTRNLKGYGMRVTVQDVDFTRGLDRPTARARAEQWAEGSAFNPNGVQANYQTMLDCATALRIASAGGSYFPTIQQLDCELRIQQTPKIDAQNLKRVHEQILLNRVP